jgi:hypothetical protein
MKTILEGGNSSRLSWARMHLRHASASLKAAVRCLYGPHPENEAQRLLNSDDFPGRTCVEIRESPGWNKFILEGATIPGTGAPKCPECGELMGSCEHVGVNPYHGSVGRKRIDAMLK